jgi:hypothetical protein
MWATVMLREVWSSVINSKTSKKLLIIGTNKEMYAFFKKEKKICTLSHIKTIIVTLAEIKDKFWNRYKNCGIKK